MKYLCHASPAQKRWLLMAGMVGAIFPDFDLLYFYLIDERKHNHHSYWTHLPVFWFVITLVWVTIFWWRNRLWAWLGIVFGLSALGHMVLDSTAGGIRWLYPLSVEYFRMTKIYAEQPWWFMNFVLHWTFLLEIAIVSSAALVYLRADDRAHYTLWNRRL